MGNSQASIISKLRSNKSVDIQEAVRLLKNSCASPNSYTDPKFFRAVIPPLAYIFTNPNPQKQLILAILQDLSFIHTRPVSVTSVDYTLNFSNVIEEYLLHPLILCLISPVSEISTAASLSLSKITPNGALFRANDLVIALQDFLRNRQDEVSKVRIIPQLWASGSSLPPIHKPLYIKLLQYLLDTETSGNIKAQIIAEFRRILHEEPTLLDSQLSTQLFLSLLDIISKHDPRNVGVVVDFAYGCLRKLIPQRRSVLGSVHLKSVIEMVSRTLAQDFLADQYLEINASLTTETIDACDETNITSIYNIAISIARHYSRRIDSFYSCSNCGLNRKNDSNIQKTVFDDQFVKLTGLLLQTIAQILRFPSLPPFKMWNPSFYQAVSIMIVSTILSGKDPIYHLSSQLFTLTAVSVGPFFQFFLGDFTLLYLVYISRLLNPCRLGKSICEESTQLNSEAIVNSIYSLPTTAERQHRAIKDKINVDLIFLAEYPVIPLVIEDQDTTEAKFQTELWTTLNIIRNATSTILTNLIKMPGRNQQQLIEWLTMIYDRMSFSGHFLLVDVLTKSLMSILVREGISLPTLQHPQSSLSSSGNLNLTASGSVISPPLMQSALSVSSLKSSNTSMIVSPQPQASASTLVQSPVPPVASSSSSSSSNVASSSTNLSSTSNAASNNHPQSILSYVPSPSSPIPNTMSISADVEMAQTLRKKLDLLEKELKSVQLERNQLSNQLCDKAKEVSEIMNQKEAILNQISCPVCFENILDNKPVCLECGHLFCGECVQNLLKSHKNCPLCKSAITKIVQVKGLSL